MTPIHPKQLGLASVYSGPIGVAHTLRATLESAGFLVFIPDENMKLLDPFVTGANCLEVSVQVPATDVDAVREHLASAKVEDVPEEPEPEPDTESQDGDVQLARDVRRVVLRMKWAIAFQLLFFDFLPIPLLLVPRYVRLVGRMDELPPEHPAACTMFVSSLALATIYSAIWAALFVGWI